MKRFLGGSGDHAVSWLKKELLRILTNSFSGIREANERSMLDHVGLDSLNIETVRIVDGRIVLNDSGDLATILLDELGGPVADSTESLNDKCLSSDSEIKVDSINESLGIEKLTDGVVDTETSRFSSSLDTTLGDEFTSAATFSVDVSLTFHIHVGVLDPGHSLLVGAHIGTKAINLSTNEALLDQLHCVLTGGSLNLSLRVLSWVNLDTAFSSTEGNVSNGKFEGHQ